MFLDRRPEPSQPIRSVGRGDAQGPTARGGITPAAPPSCDFSHIFETGEHEMQNDLAGLPKTSSWAQKYNCGPPQKCLEVTEMRAGYVYDGTRQNPRSAAWGLLPRPGTAQIFVYPKCNDGRVVADVVRIDKGQPRGSSRKSPQKS